MINDSVESVSLEKGEECTNVFTEFCSKISQEYQEFNLKPEMIIEMAMVLTAHWYSGKDELEEKELREYQEFLQKVIAYTYRHRETMNTLN